MKRWRSSLKFKVAVAFAGLLVLVLGVGTWINISLFGDEYLNWLQARAEVLAKPLKEHIQELVSQVGNHESTFIVLNGDIQALMKENPEISRVAIFNQTGKVATDSDKGPEKHQEANARIERVVEGRPQKSLTLNLGENYYMLLPQVFETTTKPYPLQTKQIIYVHLASPDAKLEVAFEF